MLTMEKKINKAPLLVSRLDIYEKPKHQPWYRERLNLKYSRKATVDASCWTFIKDGLDDYRDGKPPVLDNSIVIKRNSGLKPSLLNSDLFNDEQKQKANQRIKKHLNRNDVLYLKILPNQRKRKEILAKYEDSILSRPLEIASQEEIDLPYNVVQDIGKILDSSLEIREENIRKLKSNCISFNDESLDVLTQSSQSSECSMDPMNKVKFKNLRKLKTSKIKHVEEFSKVDMSSNPLPSELRRVDSVTKDFCDWVKSIGGENNDLCIKEDTIKDLFVCSYEGEQSLPPLIRTISLSKIPSELLTTEDLGDLHVHNDIAQNEPKSEKIIYGAWYLKPETWKARPANELLQDEKKVVVKPEKTKHDELDNRLPSLHSAQAFLMFTEEKKYPRKPDFLQIIPKKVNDNVNEDLNEKIELEGLPTIVD